MRPRGPALVAALLWAATAPACSTSAAARRQTCTADDTGKILAVADLDLSRAGDPIPASFVGFGLEPGELSTFTGGGEAGINPLFTQLLANFVPLSGAPTLRIGGDKQDKAWWVPGPHPAGTDLPVAAADIQALDRAVSPAGVKVIMGLNFKSADVGLAIAEAKGVLEAMPAAHLLGFEIGNEPDLYPSNGGRGPGWNIGDYGTELATFARTLRDAIGPSVPFVGASFSGPFTPSLPQFVAADAGLLNAVSLHHYPMSACPGTPPDSSPSIAHLLADEASTGNARTVAPLVRDAHAHGLALRIDELNSVVCHGADGVSNTFASALWILDALFSYESVGVDGVNVHAHPEGQDFYRPFGFDYDAAANVYHAHVYPIYHGLFFFAQAVQHAARLVPVSMRSTSNLKVWATIDDQQRVRVVVISKDAAASGSVIVTGISNTRSARIVELVADDASARSGVLVGGQTFEGTTDGKPVGELSECNVAAAPAGYRIPLSGAMAAMLTIGP